MYYGGIIFITDRSCIRGSVCDVVREVLEAGVRHIQLREKTLSRRRIYEEALKIRELTLEYKALLIINDHADIALAVDADGVHLGQEDLPLREARKIMGKKIVGISTHSLAEAREAEADGADYIGFGPVFPTSTKDAGAPKGVDNLGLITQNVNVPVAAIGGITVDRIASVIEAGASAVAVASGICRGDAGTNAERFLDALKKKTRRDE